MDRLGVSERLDRLTSWQADWSGLLVVVLGLGPLGFSVVDTLAELGARVTVLAAGGADEYRDLVRVVGAALIDAEGVDAARALRDASADVVIATPPYGPAHPAIVAALESGTPIWSDVEVAWRVRDKHGEPASWLLVTGSDAPGAPRREQTALLAASMLATSGRRVLPAGDRVPLLDAIRRPERVDHIIAEVSSRQLAWTGLSAAGRPRPTASLCLSVGSRPIGWHESFDDFRAALGRVYADTELACVYSRADLATRELVEDADVRDGCRAIGVGLGVPGPSDLGIVDELIVDRAFLDDRRHRAQELATRDELALIGISEPAPVLEFIAAAALARAVGVEPEHVLRGAAELRS